MYSIKASKKDDKFEQVMREFKNKTLRSSSGDLITDRNQALAIAYSESGKKSEDNGIGANALTENTKYPRTKGYLQQPIRKSLDFDSLFIKLFRDEKSGQIYIHKNRYNLKKIEGFPKYVDLENCELISLGKDYAIFAAGGDWQHTTNFTLGIQNGKPKIYDIAHNNSKQSNLKENLKRFVIQKAKKAPYGYNSEGYALQGHRIFSGLSIAIENQKGSVRKWYDDLKNESGSTKMFFDYGYIEGIKGADKEDLDVYLGPHENSPFIYAVHQQNPQTEEYDEDKLMLGFMSEEEATEAYLKQYNDPKFFGSIDEMKLEDFKEKYIYGEGRTELPLYKADHRTENGEVLEAERTYVIPIHQRFEKDQKINIQGINFTVEGPRGTYKTFFDYAEQEARSFYLIADYCHVDQIEATLGDNLDMLLGNDPSNPNMWIFHKNHPLTGKYMEDVLVMGCSCLESAIFNFLNRYPDERHLGSAEHIMVETWKRTYYQDLPKVLTDPMVGEHHYQKEYLCDILRAMDPSDSKMYENMKVDG